MIVDTDVLSATVARLNKLIQGYTILIAGANALNVDFTVAEELGAGLAKCQIAVANLTNILNAIDVATQADSFDVDKEKASQDVINVIKSLSDNTALIPNDFEVPATLSNDATVNVT